MRTVALAIGLACFVLTSSGIAQAQASKCDAGKAKESGKKTVYEAQGARDGLQDELAARRHRAGDV
jgi:hypothetical protein